MPRGVTHVPCAHDSSPADSSSGGLVVFFVDGYGFKIFSFEDLVAIQAADIIHPIPSRQNFRFIVLAGLHTKGDIFLF